MTIQNEKEAILAFFHSILDIEEKMDGKDIEKIASILKPCSKFKEVDIEPLYPKIFLIKVRLGAAELINQSAPLISKEFRKTMFAMCCELICSKGNITESSINLMVFVGKQLELSEEIFLPIGKAFITRYAWNTESVNSIHSRLFHSDDSIN